MAECFIVENQPETSPVALTPLEALLATEGDDDELSDGVMSSAFRLPLVLPRPSLLPLPPPLLQDGVFSSWGGGGRLESAIATVAVREGGGASAGGRVPADGAVPSFFLFFVGVELAGVTFAGLFRGRPLPLPEGLRRIRASYS